MQIHILVSELSQLLVKRAEIECALARLNAKIESLQHEIQVVSSLASGGMVAGVTETQRFIDENHKLLDEDDLEFLNQEYRGTGDVTAHTGIAATSLKRLAMKGIVSYHMVGYRYRFKTLDLIRYKLRKSIISRDDTP
ncbi:hypothetical protein [Roseiconus lacunae]|uniref:Helix-turn-helix domain-containing protein n=1 Tax=Roseiconus lacunae TaxID=2605694 RepID=A0ABT7PFN2_9BACT|nr:hypothetical protein [Roseiconus lacunae]MDM4015287.1 hypothetical protein [Roseiconus lacunae]